jgi:ABC-type transporter Mla subunit MlaD
MNIARNEIRTGLLVVFSLAVLVSAILYLGAPGVFVPMNTYWVYAENAAGLRPGNDVMLAGRKVGQVVKLFSPVPEKTRPIVNGEQKLKLETLIEVRVPRSAVLYRDVRVYITQYGLLGEMLIDFSSGREWAGIAEDNATFIAERTPGLEQAAPMIIEKLDPVVKKVTETLDALEKTANNLTKLTAEEGDVKKVLGEFRKFGTNMKEMTDEDGPLRLSLENLKDLTDEDGSLTMTLRNTEAFTNKLNKNDDLGVALRNFRRTSEGLNSAVGGLSPKFNNIARNLEQATDTVKRQPWRLIWPTTKKYPEDQKKRATPAPRVRRVTPPPSTPKPRIPDHKSVIKQSWRAKS